MVTGPLTHPVPLYLHSRPTETYIDSVHCPFWYQARRQTTFDKTTTFYSLKSPQYRISSFYLPFSSSLFFISGKWHFFPPLSPPPCSSLFGGWRQTNAGSASLLLLLPEQETEERRRKREEKRKGPLLLSLMTLRGDFKKNDAMYVKYLVGDVMNYIKKPCKKFLKWINYLRHWYVFKREKGIYTFSSLLFFPLSSVQKNCGIFLSFLKTI